MKKSKQPEEEFESCRLLKELLEKLSDEEKEQIWDEVSKMDLGGPTVEEYFKQLEYDTRRRKRKIPKPKSQN